MSIKDFPTTIISTKDLIDLFGNKKYYSTLKDICRGLVKKSVEIESEDEKGFSFMGFFFNSPIGKSIVLELIDNIEHKPSGK